MDGATRTTLFGVLVLVGKPVSAPHLVRLCRALGVSPTNVKSHLTRLTAEGAIIRSGLRRSHRYAVSPQRQEIVRAISTRLHRRPTQPWDGTWLMVALKAHTRRAERQRLQSGLWFDGFRPCGPDTHLRPAWPRAWAVERAQALASAASACVIGPLVGTVHLGQVRKLYELRLLDAQARQLARRIDAITDRIDDPEEAFKARLTIGGQVVEFVSHVPDLPPEIWGGLTGLRDLQSAYGRFDARLRARADAFIREVVSTSGRRFDARRFDIGGSHEPPRVIARRSSRSVPRRPEPSLRSDT
jgi:DNA-binding transcriptional regulator PaaX